MRKSRKPKTDISKKSNLVSK